MDDFAQQPLWVAHWTTAEQPRLPGNWKTWSIWQYSSNGQVAGIRGKVDLNRLPPEAHQTVLGISSEDTGVMTGTAVSPAAGADLTPTVSSVLLADNHSSVQPTVASGASRQCGTLIDFPAGGLVQWLLQLPQRAVAGMIRWFQGSVTYEVAAVPQGLAEELQVGRELRELVNLSNRSRRVLIQNFSSSTEPQVTVGELPDQNLFNNQTLLLVG